MCLNLLLKRLRASNLNFGFWDSRKRRSKYLRITPAILMRTRFVSVAFPFLIRLFLCFSILSYAGYPRTSELPLVIVHLRRP